MEEILQNTKSGGDQGVGSTKKATNYARSNRTTIRTHTPVVYYYPSMLAAFFYGSQTGAAATELATSNASVFIALFFFNTLVVLFDFSTYRSVFITLGLSVVGLLLWNLKVLDAIFDIAKGINMQMNSHAFFAFGIFLLAMLIGDTIWAHLNRWVFSPNEVKHIRFLVGEASMPGRGLSFRRKITDIFEYVLGFGAGTIILRVGRRKIHLRNVIRAQSKIAQIESYIRTSGVFSDEADVFDDFDDDMDDDEMDDDI